MLTFSFWRRFLLLLACSGCLSVELAIAAGIDPPAAAKRVDEMLAEELFGGDQGAAPTVAGKADDETYLRRLSLDLIGNPPTPEEITTFALDSSPQKRTHAAERLLTNSQFGDNWARYWRDVIMYRRSEDRALLASPALVKYLADAFNTDPHWDKIARQFITASGDVREQGATALIMAQMANAEDTTAEISRIFLGIQIQCAQCHNHPTDRWKREQFHELAAFFPRVAVRPLRKGEERSFEIVSLDKARGKEGKKPGRGTLEHHMPDLKHPEQEGTVMKPVFFVTGQQLETGVADQDRRQSAAEWITAPGNHWFAKAFVNRMWSELVGRGFYEPVDDIGPDRSCSAPHTLDYLSEQFTTSQYDVKWLLATITATDAYQRESRSRSDADGAPFAANCPQRLRGDQLFNSLLAVLGVDEAVDPRDQKGYRGPTNGPRGKTNQAFGYDPSARRDEVAGSIPQALFLMNGPELNRGLNGRDRSSALGALLAEVPDDAAVVDELYLRSLAREPKESERQTCLDHVRSTGNRTEAFEDILWSLVNSTEFLNRK